MSDVAIPRPSVHDPALPVVRAWLTLSGAYGARVGMNTLAKVVLGAALTTWLNKGQLTLWVLATSFAVVVSQIVDAGFQHIAVRASSVGLTSAHERRSHAIDLLGVIAKFAVPSVCLSAALALVADSYWLPSSLKRSDIVIVFVAAMAGAFLQMAGTTLAAYLIGAGRAWIGISCTGLAMFAWASVASTGAALGIALPVCTICAQIPFMVMAVGVWRLLGAQRIESRVPAVVANGHSRPARIVPRDLTSFVLYNVSGFVITGIDVYVVAAFDPSRVAGYSYAIQATSLCFLLCTALANPLVIQTAKHTAGATVVPSLSPVIRVTGLVGSACVLFLGLGALWFDRLSNLWLGGVGRDASLVFIPLALAACLRSLLVPSLLGAIGSGQLSTFVQPSLIEAGVNLVTSVGLGLRFGAVGVAIGSLVGSVAALVMFSSTVRRWGVDIKSGHSLVKLVLSTALVLCVVGAVVRQPSSWALRTFATMLLLVATAVHFGTAQRRSGVSSLIGNPPMP